MKNKLLLFPFLIILSLTTFAQSGETKGWPSRDRHDFIDECVKTASKGMSTDSARFYCFCMQQKMETIFPKVDDANKMKAEDFNSPEWKVGIKNCLSGYWNKKDRTEFLTNCIDAAKAGIGEEKAKSYCECMLFKMENKFPNSADAGKVKTEDMEKPEWKKLIRECLDF